MFILDEPTSALDPGSEYDVYSKFIQLVKTKTSILISHRLGIIKLAENIVVLENGLVKEKGSHNELIRLGGTYSKLYDLQAGYYR
jgi:ABC-type multidrug transport system fused ATPase/permease subunit